MNFLTFSRLTEESLPDIGLVRQTRDPVRNQQYIEVGIKKRDAHCFNWELTRRCASYLAYKRQQNARKQTQRLLSNKTPEDMAKVILDFCGVETKDPADLLPFPGYHHIVTKNEYRWYIMLSNIMPMFPNTGLNPTHLHRYLKRGEFHSTYYEWIKKINKLYHLQNGGLFHTCPRQVLTAEAQAELYPMLENLYNELRL